MHEASCIHAGKAVHEWYIPGRNNMHFVRPWRSHTSGVSTHEAVEIHDEETVTKYYSRLQGRLLPLIKGLGLTRVKEAYPILCRILSTAPFVTHCVERRQDNRKRSKRTVLGMYTHVFVIWWCKFRRTVSKILTQDVPCEFPFVEQHMRHTFDTVTACQL